MPSGTGSWQKMYPEEKILFAKTPLQQQGCNKPAAGFANSTYI
jgi:hypothetical protein